MRSALIPYNPRSELWQNLTVGEVFSQCIVPSVSDTSKISRFLFLKKFSTSPRHYDHTKVERGICVPECVATNLIGGIVANVSVELQYSLQLQQCVNEDLRQKYGLHVDSVTIQYCYDDNEELFTIGRLLPQ